ncbi:MAG: extracellular solute-binding protein [Anaerolineae bacterium]|nr:extracellular solute-binding protein [Anaerolineae bacterium]
MKRALLTRRQFVRSVALSVGSVIAAGCAPKVVEKVVKETVVQQQEVEKLVTPSPASPLTIKVWTTGGDVEAQMMLQAGDLFRLSNPNVTIQAEPISWNDSASKTLAAVAAREGPDVITCGMGWGIELGRQGGMVDLKESYPDITLEIKERTIPGIWNAIVPPSGEVYAVEWQSTLQMMYYRTDLLKELCGRETPPDTWDDLTAVLAQLQAVGKTSPIIVQWGNLNWMGLFMFLYAQGGRFYDEQCSGVVFDSAETRTAMKYFTDFYLKFSAPTDGWPDAVPFVMGDAAVMVTGNWMIPEWELTKPELAEKWMASSFPKAPSGTRATFTGGTVVGIMSYAKPEVRDTAAHFIRFLYTPEAVRAEMNYAAAQKSMFIPPSPEFMDLMPVSEVNKQAIRSTLADAFGPPNCKGWDQSSQHVDRAIQEVVLNGADLDQAVKDAAAGLQAGLGA